MNNALTVDISSLHSVQVESSEEASIFCNLLEDAGYMWRDGTPMTEYTGYDENISRSGFFCYLIHQSIRKIQFSTSRNMHGRPTEMVRFSEIYVGREEEDVNVEGDMSSFM